MDFGTLGAFLAFAVFAVAIVNRKRIAKWLKKVKDENDKSGEG